MTLATPPAFSAPDPGTCAAVGNYTDGAGSQQGFVASETNGVWGQAIEVPGLGALNKGDAEAFSVSCAPAGGCAAGGYYTGRLHHSQGFVVNQTG